MKVVPWPKASYGKFHTGDSYIVLQVLFVGNLYSFFSSLSACRVL